MPPIRPNHADLALLATDPEVTAALAAARSHNRPVSPPTHLHAVPAPTVAQPDLTDAPVDAPIGVRVSCPDPEVADATARLLDAVLRAVGDTTSTVTVDHPADTPVIPAQSRSEPNPGASLHIRPTARRVLVHGREIHLTKLEFDLLLFCYEHRGRVLHRNRLMSEVWGMPPGLSSRTIDVHIRRLRAKLGRDVAAIHTVRGVGYRFDADDVHVDYRPG